jgi:hypothetical protein
MRRLDAVAKALLLVMTGALPFEFQAPSQELSILQLLFIAVFLTSIPNLIRGWGRLSRNRFVIAAAVFVFVFWLTAYLAESFRLNAIEAAIRVSCGFILMCIVLCIGDAGGKNIEKVLCWTAIAAAVYGVLDYWGLGFSSLFRGAEFYAEDIQRLSGSFEYPNTAGSFYAMALPFAWSYAPAISLVLWLALALTLSRGAMIAIFAVLIISSVPVFLKRGAREAKSWMTLAAAGAGVYVVAAIFQPFISDRLQPARPAPQSTNARYYLQFNQMTAAPGGIAHMPVSIENIGSSLWKNVVLSAHWYDVEKRKLMPVPEIINPLPEVVSPSQRISIDAAVRLPDAAGAYLLDWDLKVGDRWFSIIGGVAPGIVEAKIQPGTRQTLSVGDTRRWYGSGGGPSLDASVARPDLWRAAVTLFRTHPILGIGPDNFRLRYGQLLGYTRWDANVRANSLYLELLAGSGVLGLIAFAVMIGSVRWTLQPASLAVAVFLVHGLVDAFLMTTPIYFAFWMLLGRMHADRI